MIMKKQKQDYYRQEIGLIQIPDNFSKWKVSWSLDNIIEGFKMFKAKFGYYPIKDQDFAKVEYLPNIKTIQRKFGGIKKIRLSLGLENTDFSKGNYRSAIASKIGERGFVEEEKLYKHLVDVFYEPFVHNQSRIKISGFGSSVNVDFLVFYKNGKFAIDVYYPDSNIRDFSNNTSAKYRAYKNFPAQINLFLVVANSFFTQKEVKKFLQNKSTRDKKVEVEGKNIKIVTQEILEQVIFKNHTPLNNPYK